MRQWRSKERQMLFTLLTTIRYGLEKYRCYETYVCSYMGASSEAVGGGGRGFSLNLISFYEKRG